MIPHGEIIKRAIRGGGYTIKDAATKLGMSRENLYYYLNSASIPEAFLQKVNTGLELNIVLPEWDNKLFNVKHNKHEKDSTKDALSPEWGSDKSKSPDYISTPLIKSVLTMGMLLKMSHEQLMSLLSEETNAENFKLIQEVISTKKEIEHLKEQNTTLKKYADSLEKQLRQ